MRTITQNVFQFSELSEKSKAVARASYVESMLSDSWYEHVLSDAESVAHLLGFYDFKVYFSGFYSQGDGACFTGRYSYEKGAPQKIASYAPEDKELLRISKALQAAQKKQFYAIKCEILHRGRYCHEKSMSFNFEDPRKGGWNGIEDAIEKEFSECFEYFATWIYAQLEREYDHQTSDETVESLILANGFEYFENGVQV